MTRRQDRQDRRLRAYTICLGLLVMMMALALLALLAYLAPGASSSTILGCLVSAGVTLAAAAYAVVLGWRDRF
jgi:hypothetical protein